ncbi:MAG TPA: branched-chain amino acid ABC transporter permease [Terriglobales bacterium]|nr:branched-chain amino acid ABC transporter permease [Terriglobales bacterium]
MTTAAGAPFRLEARARILLPWLLLAVLAILPSAGLTANITRLLFVTFVWVTTSLGWNLLGGFTGQVSFGFAVFYGLGAYTAALLIDRGVNPYLSFVVAGVIPAVASVFIGLPTFRLRGPYFAIATIGVSEATRVIMNNLAITGGASGYRIMEQRPFRQVEHYYTALGMAALAVAVSFLIEHSKFGMALRAIKQDEAAAADLGVNPYAYKLAIHAVAAALTGIAGGVLARYAAFINPQGVFAFQTSVYILLMPVIGGIGTVWGAVLGGVVFGVVEEQLVANFPQIHLLLYGSLLILIILLEPDGLAGLLGKLYRRLRTPKRTDGDTHPGSREADQVLRRAGGG